MVYLIYLSVCVSLNCDRVELLLTPKKADLLLYQMGLALKSSLEVDGNSSSFYIDSLATAMAAHLLRHYSTRQHNFREHEDGLSKQKLRQAVDYINEHLGEDLSLSAIASELGMSQYYFCHLFKQSTGMSPHQYLMRQRVERAKHLLKQRDDLDRKVAYMRSLYPDAEIIKDIGSGLNFIWVDAK